MWIRSVISFVQLGIVISLNGPNICFDRPLIGSSSIFPQNNRHEYCCEDFHEVSGRCEGCPAGQYGLKCQLSCPDGHYGFRCKHRCNCLNDGMCHKVDGCVCRDGFSGEACEKACIPGKFGNRCQQKCNCSAGFTCESVTGKCVCPQRPTQGLCNYDSTIKLHVQGITTTTYIKDATSEAFHQGISYTYGGGVAENRSNYISGRKKVAREPFVIYNIVVICTLVIIWLLMIINKVKEARSTKRDQNIQRNKNNENNV
ncbi:unnamed protein product [Mytilus coruscus]|uniref:EGF-like domain-containing protein n=1 Tax=Mytilus coruscus TaxID=42192 RepID=A0A6J8D3W2_MYTCO|nr:unnamed protein product [Mytilus coruscus]